MLLSSISFHIHSVDPRVLLIFIPIFLVRLLWSLFQPILGAPSDVLAFLGMLIDALAVGMAMLWLLAYKFGNRNRFVSFLLALVVPVTVTVVAILSYQAWSFGINFEIYVIQALGIVTMLLVGLIFAICIYMLNLPFMILAFVSPFFRERFYAYFHLKSMLISSSSGTDTTRSDNIEQTE